MTAEQLEVLAVCIAEVIPDPSLRNIVEQHQVVAQFDSLAKHYTGPVEGRARAVVEGVLSQYQARNVLPILLETLYGFSHGIPGTEHLRSLLEPGLLQGDRKEALLSRRDNFFLSENLQSRLAEFIPKVCCILGNYTQGGVDYQKQGTGFLLGPDLVLTAMHIFEPLNELNFAMVPESYRVIFDHLQGAPLSRAEPAPSGVRCVRLAQDWQVAGARSLDKDGEIAEPDERQQDLMKEHLDFVLIRLAEPVGLEPVSPWGGRARAWIKLPDVQTPQSLMFQERLVITQHPAGSPQCLDFGRFERVCPSQTRIFYSVSTEQGSSGAPCFNQKFELVGMHNAKFKPENCAVAKANQAIRFDRIQAHIAPLIRDTDLPVPARLWNLSSDHNVCRPIIGRGVLLKWIEDSARADTEPRERFFAAVVDTGQGGRTFSWEVLVHQHKGNPKFKTLIFDKDKNRVPLALEDLIAMLAGTFNISISELSPMPARTADDNDKVRRWASQLVPQWFCSQLEAFRTTEQDRRELARGIVRNDILLGRDVDPDVQALAESLDPLPEQVQLWTHAWIVFDDLHVMAINQEIQDFLAGVAQMANSGNETFQVLQRLRWMFLGQCPTFLDPSHICVENIGAHTYIEGIDALAQDIMSAAPYAKSEVIRDVIDTLKLMMEEAGVLSDNPATQLKLLQRVASMTLTKKLPIWMNQ